MNINDIPQFKVTKVCCDCKKELPTSCFSKNKSRKDGLDPKCRECRAAYMRHYRFAHAKESSLVNSVLTKKW